MAHTLQIKVVPRKSESVLVTINRYVDGFFIYTNLEESIMKTQKRWQKSELNCAQTTKLKIEMRNLT
ncbi:hypothetical protein LOOC260_121350 [Paucilactobacillus hokkaidonensis JCM 18461]|uniref:Uncharacterized protein n=1 Tax=Paucilactobacillus hokkaidonensis JCM 18461 TaxID=1291742 RepID=A0A0A1H1R9_9LACO|nr:hypothetical protein LOOC260_121350 [Paucilactobacillus hokkaidonensis JCM 18461]